MLQQIGLLVALHGEHEVDEALAADFGGFGLPQQRLSLCLRPFSLDMGKPAHGKTQPLQGRSGPEGHTQMLTVTGPGGGGGPTASGARDKQEGGIALRDERRAALCRGQTALLSRLCPYSKSGGGLAQIDFCLILTWNSTWRGMIRR